VWKAGGLTSRAGPSASGMALLPASAWGPADAGALSVLRALAPMWVTGGWVRDRLLESGDVNRDASAAWRRLRHLTGNPPGDLDVLVAGVSARDFHASCRRSEALRAALRGPPLLVPARGGRSLDTVKLRLPEHSVDVTSLLDAQRHFGSSAGVGAGAGAGAGSSDALMGDAEHRDTTFNACYYDMATERVLDPSRRGLADLRDGVVRVPHSGGALASFEEDPVRLLRVFRFASRFGFELDEELGRALEETTDVLDHLRRSPPGRLLFELKKAMLLHNRPSRFFGLLGGPAGAHRHLFGEAGPAFLDTWPAAVGRVRRLEALVLEGLERGNLTSRSIQWRGRRADGPPPAMLAPDWRKTGIYENDWAELLLTALFWRCDEDSLRRVGAQLQLSLAMIDNIARLHALARQKIIAVQTAPPGVHLLNSAVASQESPSDFWDRWPCSSRPGSFDGSI